MPPLVPVEVAPEEVEQPEEEQQPEQPTNAMIYQKLLEMEARQQRLEARQVEMKADIEDLRRLNGAAAFADKVLDGQR